MDFRPPCYYHFCLPAPARDGFAFSSISWRCRGLVSPVIPIISPESQLPLSSPVVPRMLQEDLEQCQVEGAVCNQPILPLSNEISLKKIRHASKQSLNLLTLTL